MEAKINFFGDFIVNWPPKSVLQCKSNSNYNRFTFNG
jgi:hypothetical protein